MNGQKATTQWRFAFILVTVSRFLISFSSLFCIFSFPFPPAPHLITEPGKGKKEKRKEKKEKEICKFLWTCRTHKLAWRIDLHPAGQGTYNTAFPLAHSN